MINSSKNFFKAGISMRGVQFVLSAGVLFSVLTVISGVGISAQSQDSGSNAINGFVANSDSDLNNSQAKATLHDESADIIEKWLEEGIYIRRRSDDISDLISWYAERQLGITYVGGLLDEPDEEQLVVTLEGTDCVIYVETSLALAMTTLQGSASFDDFQDNLRLIRYREGKINGYESRLHYFSDWVATNEGKGLISMLFQDDGLPVIGPVHFMTANRESYRHLTDNDDTYKHIRNMEVRLADRIIRYIPSDLIPDYESQFQTGDVLAFVTTIDGLDIVHTGLIKMRGNRAGFYHASLTGSVIVDPNNVFEYANNRSNISGILIARLKVPD